MKKCSLCGKDLLVYYDTEGEQVCNECFVQPLNKDPTNYSFVLTKIVPDNAEYLKVTCEYEGGKKETIKIKNLSDLRHVLAI